MKRSGKGSSDRPVRWCVFDTRLGPCGIAWTAEGLLRLQLPGGRGGERGRGGEGVGLGREAGGESGKEFGC